MSADAPEQSLSESIVPFSCEPELILGGLGGKKKRETLTDGYLR